MASMRRHLSLLLCLALAGLSVPLDAVRQPLRAKHGMVVAMEATAADVGVAVLQKGGNAVDAAVAVGFAMAVTHPFAGNLGGGGFMLIRMADGRATFIDFRERAPEKASRNMYLDAKGDADEGQHRRLALVGRARHGARLRDGRQQIRQEERGRRTWRRRSSSRRRASRCPTRWPKALKGSRSLASSPGVEAHLPEATARSTRSARRWSQPELAQTLERISKNGANEFYEGETAKRFADGDGEARRHHHRCPISRATRRSSARR